MSKRKKHVTYKVWIEIEEFNEKSGEGTSLNGAALRDFDTYKEAWDFANRLTEIAENVGGSK